jgi:hypothetical protein
VTPFLRALCLLALIAAAGCGRSSPLAGQYEAAYGDDGRDRTIVLDLREGGQGAWTVDDASITFKWDVRGDEVLLHTRTGGVIRVAVGDGELTADLPGAGRLVFRRAGK